MILLLTVVAVLLIGWAFFIGYAVGFDNCLKKYEIIDDYDNE